MCCYCVKQNQSYFPFILKGITNTAERKELVNYLLDKVNLYEKRKKSVKGFSGGMKQRVGIARAFALSPKML